MTSLLVNRGFSQSELAELFLLGKDLSPLAISFSHDQIFKELSFALLYIHYFEEVL